MHPPDPPPKGSPKMSAAAAAQAKEKRPMVASLPHECHSCGWLGPADNAKMIWFEHVFFSCKAPEDRRFPILAFKVRRYEAQNDTKGMEEDQLYGAAFGIDGLRCHGTKGVPRKTHAVYAKFKDYMLLQKYHKNVQKKPKYRSKESAKQATPHPSNSSSKVDEQAASVLASLGPKYKMDNLQVPQNGRFVSDCKTRGQGSSGQRISSSKPQPMMSHFNPPTIQKTGSVRSVASNISTSSAAERFKIECCWDGCGVRCLYKNLAKHVYFACRKSKCAALVKRIQRHLNNSGLAATPSLLSRIAASNGNDTKPLSGKDVVPDNTVLARWWRAPDFVHLKRAHTFILMARARRGNESPTSPPSPPRHQAPTLMTPNDFNRCQNRGNRTQANSHCPSSSAYPMSGGFHRGYDAPPHRWQAQDWRSIGPHDRMLAAQDSKFRYSEGLRDSRRRVLPMIPSGPSLWHRPGPKRRRVENELLGTVLVITYRFSGFNAGADELVMIGNFTMSLQRHLMSMGLPSRQLHTDFGDNNTTMTLHFLFEKVRFADMSSRHRLELSVSDSLTSLLGSDDSPKPSFLERCFIAGCHKAGQRLVCQPSSESIKEDIPGRCTPKESTNYASWKMRN